MKLSNAILSDIREAIGLSTEPSPFDNEILMHINASTGKLNQNGVGKSIPINNTTTWLDFQDPNQTKGNESFHMIPLFITLSTKLLFDPPPPSSVEYHANNAEQLLWRLKITYEEPYVTPTSDDA